jgi:hypothetical protein
MHPRQRNRWNVVVTRRTRRWRKACKSRNEHEVFELLPHNHFVSECYGWFTTSFWFAVMTRMRRRNHVPQCQTLKSPIEVLRV